MARNGWQALSSSVRGGRASGSGSFLVLDLDLLLYAAALAFAAAAASYLDSWDGGFVFGSLYGLRAKFSSLSLLKVAFMALTIASVPSAVCSGN